MTSKIVQTAGQNAVAEAVLAGDGGHTVGVAQTNQNALIADGQGVGFRAAKQFVNPAEQERSDHINTKGAWILRFDDILADALELGPLKKYDLLQQKTIDLLAEATPKGIPDDLLPMLAQYYLAQLREGEEWVLLPVSAVDAYYGNNSFSKKWKSVLPKNLIEFKNSYGICKYRITI